MVFERRRAELVEALSGEISDRHVLAAMARVPREMFVPPDMQFAAYEDRPLPIGYEQTISQPFIIALMTQALELSGEDRVLEIGTGSGYQTAILAELAARVITVERISALSVNARNVLHKLGYRNIEFHLAGDGLGWPDGGPYTAILVTAGAPYTPQTLVDQLDEGGRLVIPVGSRYNQQLYQIIRHGTRTEVNDLGGCRFVSLIGEDAWDISSDKG